jgi:anti-sigma regulatory factor (Ser/Thr protein kinase)
LINTCIAVQEATHAAEARRAALAAASALSFDETAAGNVGVVVTEAAKNLLKHAGGGQMILRTLDDGGAVGLEILALDKGPGIADLSRCRQDGYSTAGTSGTGLGAISRMSHVHEIYTRRGQGTALMAQIWKGSHNGHAARSGGRFSVGGVSVPLAGQSDCGDDWVYQELPHGCRVTVADGLGHGEHAAIAARAGVRTARERPSETATELMRYIHAALKPTRGAAVAVAEIDSGGQLLRFTGVGNISAAIITDSGVVRRLVSMAGTAGHEVRKITEFQYPWDAGSVLVMHSDGLQTHWSFDTYPGLFERHPSLIAGVFYRDYTRGRDDVSVVVVREAKPEP